MTLINTGIDPFIQEIFDADDLIECAFAECELEAHWVHHCPSCGKARLRCAFMAHEHHFPPWRPVRCAGDNGCGNHFDFDYWYSLYHLI